MALSELDQQRVIKIIAKHLGDFPSDVEPAKRIMGDLGGDSLDIVEISMAIEDELGVQMPDAFESTDPTVQEYFNLLERAREAA